MRALGTGDSLATWTDPDAISGWKLFDEPLDPELDTSMDGASIGHKALLRLTAQ